MINSLFKRLTIDKIKVSWSHGDFQEANILISKNNYKVIDWEGSNKRYYLYDEFVLLSRIRSNISIEEANRNYSVNQDKIKNLLKEMNSMIAHIVKVGDYLSKTTESYAKFYKVWNGKFIKNANQFLSDDYTLEIKKMPEYHFAKGEDLDEVESTKNWWR